MRVAARAARTAAAMAGLRCHRARLASMAFECSPFNFLAWQATPYNFGCCYKGRKPYNETRDVARDTARATAGEDTESRYQRRRRLLNNARWGKDGKWAKMADTLESVPVLGETALAPMTGFLRGAVDLYTTFRPGA